MRSRACRTRFRRLQLTVIALQASVYCICSRKNYAGRLRYSDRRRSRIHVASSDDGACYPSEPFFGRKGTGILYEHGPHSRASREKYGVSREDQDAFAVRSHQNAAKALAEGKFKDEIVPVEVTVTEIGEDHKPMEKQFVFSQDEGVRPQTTADILSTLRPAFSVDGTVTAGNSSQTSDGAAAVMLMDREKADALGLAPLVKFRSFAVGGVPPEVMGIGPVEAIPRALKLAGLQLQDIGLFELNEAFASQAIQVIRELGIDEEKVNVNGGAIALGHPLGCTGTKLTLSLIHEMKRRNEQFGVVTMCIGGGMGAAGVFELC